MSNASTVASTACAFLAAANLAFGGFRPPAVPLATHDPYFSIWSPADRLTDAWPVHWTGATHALASMIRVDGKALRLMGVEPGEAPAMNQERVQVLPTRTIYTFRSPEVQVTLTFMSPLLPQDLDVLSRPVIGGVFLKLMEEPERWNKWVQHSEKVRGNWAARSPAALVGLRASGSARGVALRPRGCGHEGGLPERGIPCWLQAI